ncbi:MAG: YggT family protein [Chloroflexota bacterium]
MIGRVIFLVCEILTIALLFRSVTSLMSPGQTNHPTNVLYLVTEPILAPLRRILPKYSGVDYSSFVAIAILNLIILVLYFIGSV